MMHQAPILVVFIPLMTAFLTPIIGAWRKNLCYPLTIAATLLSFISSIGILIAVIKNGTIHYRLGDWEPPWGIEYAVDYFSGYILVIIAFICFMTTVYAGKGIKKEVGEERAVTFTTIYMLLVVGLLGVVITGDVFNLYVFLEIQSLSAYVLVAVGPRRDALVASFNYLILGTIGATFYLLGIGYLYIITGTLNMADLAARLPMLYHTKVALTAFALFTIGLSIKFALFPLHTWLLGAHSEAPSVVSAILAGAVLKVNVYALLRIMFTVFQAEFILKVIPVTKIFLVLAVTAIIVGSVLTVAQTNIKRMLALSSVGQMGYIVLGVALANRTAMTGSLLHILNHSLMKSALFLIAGRVSYRIGSYDLDAWKGLGRKMPFSMAAFTIAGLSMIGVPLTVGFVSKWYLAIGALEAGMWFIVPVIILSSLLAAVYFWRVIEGIYFPEKSGASSQNPEVSNSSLKDDTPISMLIPIFILAGLCILFGIAAFIPVSVAEKAANMLLGGM